MSKSFCIRLGANWDIWAVDQSSSWKIYMEYLSILVFTDTIRFVAENENCNINTSQCTQAFIKKFRALVGPGGFFKWGGLCQ